MRLTDDPRRDVPICAGTVVVLMLLLWPVTACGCSKVAAKSSRCLSNVKAQTLGLLQYVANHDDRFPSRDLWLDGIKPYVKLEAVLHDPELAKTKDGYGYAFNAALSRAREPKSPEGTPTVYDSVNPVRNASDPMTSLPNPGRHWGRNAIGYADGHARLVPLGKAP